MTLRRLINCAIVALALSTAGVAQVTFSAPQASPVRSTPVYATPPSFTAPQFQAPIRTTPTFSVIQFSAPQPTVTPFSQPSFRNPTFQVPTATGGGGRYSSGSYRYVPTSVSRASSSSAGQAQSRFSSAVKTI